MSSLVHLVITRRSVVDAFAAAGVIVVWLPPYTPSLNPIETVFNMMKKGLEARGLVDSEEGVMEAVMQELFNIQGAALYNIARSSCSEYLDD